MIGAGAVGSYYGALLAHAGHDVALVARGAHAAALRRAGAVCVREADGEQWSVPVRVPPSPRAALRDGADLVLVTVKSHHTAEAGAGLAAALGDGAARRPDVLSLQNGVENPAVLRRLLPPEVPVLAGLAFVGLRVVTPGTVDHQAEGRVVLGDPAGGRTAAAARVHGLVAGAWDARLAEDVAREQWSKLLWNIGFNALCAVTGATAGEALATPETRALVREAMDEVVALAASHGVAVPPERVAAMSAYIPGLRDYRPSTAQDIAAGKPVEREALTAFMVRAGAARGVPTPVNRVLDALLALQEDRATGRIAARLDALAAAVSRPGPPAPGPAR
ncbi:MAG TPA: 2-dehydropantoate 2-reductase [Miltoncostaeaceae bacterium]|nr:2-dehydropantoate 2-reductase [Miltoncostaeaceae bacterium]